MASFIARRLILLVPVLLGVSVMTFVISHVAPANPARLMAGPRAGAAQVEAVRHAYGLDLPLWQQYLRYLGDLARGNLGTSFHTQHPVRDDLASFLPATVELAVAAMVITVLVGVPLGIVSAVFRGRWVDHVSRLIAVSGASLPVFWLALVAQLVLYGRLGWFPSGGRLDTGLSPPPAVTGMYTVDSLLAGNPRLFGNALWHLALPAAVLAFGALAVVARLVRGSLLGVLRQEYIRTARAKGLTRRAVIRHHALRNALLPTLTVLGLQTGYLLSGAILVELVFSWSGIGLYTAQSIGTADYNAVMSVTLVVAALFMAVNLLVDVLYALADPRIHFG